MPTTQSEAELDEARLVVAYITEQIIKAELGKISPSMQPTPEQAQRIRRAVLDSKELQEVQKRMVTLVSNRTSTVLPASMVKVPPEYLDIPAFLRRGND